MKTKKPAAKSTTAAKANPTKEAPKKRKTCKSKLLNKVWFTDQFAARQISQRQLAFKIGMDPAAMSLVLSGKRKLQMPEAEAIAAQLGLPVTEVLTNSGMDMGTGASEDALVAGWIGAMGEIHEGRAEGPRRAPTPVGMPSETRVLRYQGGDATRGWLVYYAPVNGVSIDAIGRLCVVKTSQGASYVGRLVRGYSSGLWNLIDLFSHGVIEGVRVVSAAPVAWIKTG